MLRLLSERFQGRVDTPGAGTELPVLTADEVAVLIPAHNEELVLRAAIDSAARQVPLRNIHVIADGCTDNTAQLARSCMVNVLELQPGRGKAGGIEAAVDHFDLPSRFSFLLIVDADTELDSHYLERGLRLMSDDNVTALAGYARSVWRPADLSLTGRFLAAYRARLYFAMQWIKYGQTWRFTNVTAIVPGFASMYRTRVLPQMNLNPPGLVIEDFNMTFELHHKRLGRIAFQPSVFAWTQDPGNFPDYFSQVTRWWLGFWQTLFRHKLWASGFCVALSLFLFESVLASLILILVTLGIVLDALPSVSGDLLLNWDLYQSFEGLSTQLLSPTNLLLFLFLPDYLLTCIVALSVRRPSLLIYGFGFIPIRIVDAVVILRTLVTSRILHSNGQWTSPARRPVADRSAAVAGDVDRGVVSAPVGSEQRQSDRAASACSDTRGRRIVLRDGLFVAAAVVLAALLVQVMPVPVLISSAMVILGGALVWSYRKRWV